MSDSKLFPTSLVQNPSSVQNEGQDFEQKHRAQVENILGDFLTLLADNYVSKVPGPHYVLQYQAFAEAIAEVQITAQEVFEDSDFDFTRSEFLFQILGALVFPEGATRGIPTLEGDVTYRSFLKAMVLLLLRGAKPDVAEEGIELLTDSDITLIEKAIAARETEGSAWGFDEQFEFEVNVSTDDGTAFPAEDPFVLAENVRLVMRALKPAHTIFDYRHLFLDTFGDVFEDTPLWEITHYYYDDARRFCGGAKNITGDAGETLTDRRLFSDTSRVFSSIQPGAKLVVESGTNEGIYRVEEILGLPVGTDTTARSYTTSPTGLTGTVTAEDDDLEDPNQDWSLAAEGEVITIASGPNAGSYRLGLVLGTNGGPVGFADGPETKVRVAQSLLRLETRMPYTATGQSYTVEVDYLGVKVPKEVAGEDASALFYL
jgi:hypothetical protein